MKCPACQASMSVEDFGGVEVDVCKSGCKGIWFDWHELTRLDEDHEGFGNALREAAEHPRANDEKRGRLNCPRCSSPMHAHRYKRAQQVNVDECYACGGIFLDSGELQAVREEYMSDAEQQAYVRELMEDIPAMHALREDTERMEMRSSALHRMTRVLRLSYWMTGK